MPVGNFKWDENTSHFSKDFKKNYNKDSDEGYFVEFDIQYPKKLHFFHPFCLKEQKLKIKKTCSHLA